MATHAHHTTMCSDQCSSGSERARPERARSASAFGVAPLADDGGWAVVSFNNAAKRSSVMASSGPAMLSFGVFIDSIAGCVPPLRANAKQVRYRTLVTHGRPVLCGNTAAWEGALDESSRFMPLRQDLLYRVGRPGSGDDLSLHGLPEALGVRVPSDGSGCRRIFRVALRNTHAVCQDRRKWREARARVLWKLRFTDVCPRSGCPHQDLWACLLYTSDAADDL